MQGNRGKLDGEHRYGQVPKLVETGAGHDITNRINYFFVNKAF